MNFHVFTKDFKKTCKASIEPCVQYFLAIPDQSCSVFGDLSNGGRIKWNGKKRTKKQGKKPFWSKLSFSKQGQKNRENTN